MLETMNGPADGPGPLSWALLNASGVAVALFHALYYLLRAGFLLEGSERERAARPR